MRIILVLNAVHRFLVGTRKHIPRTSPIEMMINSIIDIEVNLFSLGCDQYKFVAQSQQAGNRIGM